MNHAKTGWRILRAGVRCAAGIWLAAQAAQAAEHNRPNLVIFYADDLDADEMNWSMDPNLWPSYSGGEKLRATKGHGYKGRMLTPNLDALAAGGAVLTRFYISSPVCTPSRYSLITGRLASRSPALREQCPEGSYAPVGFNVYMTKDESNLPKCLQAAGYATGMVGKWHNFNEVKFDKKHILDHNPTLADYQAPGAEEGVRANYERALAALRDGYGWDFVDRINIGNSVFNLEWMTEGALQFIDQNKTKPFFLYMALPVPHGQYQYPYNNVSKLEPRATSSGLIDHLPKVMPSRASIYERLEKAGLPPEYAMATHMDDAVGAVLKKLDDMGVRDNTLILFVGDNPSRGKNSVFEGAREPAIVSWPARIKPGSRMQSLTSNIDVAATFVDAAGGTLPSDIAVDSRSFLPQLLGRPEPADWRKALLLEIGYSKALVTERWKYIANRMPPALEAGMKADAERTAQNSGERTFSWLGGTTFNTFRSERDFSCYYDADQLYDLHNDLYETQNLMATQPETAANMQRMLKDDLASLPFAFGEFKPATAESVLPKESKDRREN